MHRRFRVGCRWLPAGTGPGGGHLTVLLTTALLTGAAACAAGALAAAARDPPPEVVDRSVALTAVVRTVPKQLQPQPGREPTVLVSVRLLEMRLGQRSWRVDLPARLFAARSEWPAEAQPGSVVTGRGTVAARERAQTEVVAELGTPPVVQQPPQGWAAAGNAVRAGLAAALAGGDADAASLVAGIALGDESGQSPAFAEAMRAAGLSHLTAVSGGNIAIVLALVLALLRSAHSPPAVQWVGCAAALAGYTALVGPQPSVLRAAAMGVVALVGVLFGGPARGARVLFGCVLLLLLFAPELALSLGFALSVAATGALLLAVHPLQRAIAWATRNRLPEPVVAAVTVAIAAQAATAPLLLAVGNSVSWLAVPANVVAAVAVTPITVLGLIAALAATVAPPIAAVVAAAAVPPAALVVRTAYLGASAASSDWAAELPAWGLGIALCGGALTLLVRRRCIRGPSRTAIVGVAVAALVTAGLVVPRPGGTMPADWRLIACDVGQGTAVLLRTETAAVLVDTGPEDGGVIGCLQAADVTRLDAVVLTHHHADHVGDIAAVLGGRPVGQVIVGPGRYPEAGVELVMAAAAEHAVPVSTVAAGQQLIWPGMRSAVLWPRPTDRGSPDDVNNGSLVLVHAWNGGGTALTPGDVEPESQAAIMAAWPGPRVDVVLIPHHASDSQDPRFAAWSGPVLALASAGADNSYGHPAPETLAEYQQLGVAVARTDESGSVGCVWRDGRLEVFN